MFNRKKLKVYLSFPISEPRKKEDDDYFSKLITWRSRIHNEFVAFDPLAIDEGRFDIDKEGKVKPKLKPRIPYAIGEPIVPPPQKAFEEWTSIDLQSIINFVIQQIGERDYKLESQSNFVAMWRPVYGKETHDGVNAEGAFARANRITTHSYHPLQDETPSKPFPPHFGVPHRDEDELFEIIKLEQQKWQENQTKETY